MVVFSRLLPSLASAYAVQAAFALIFVPQADERFYDFGGSVGYLSTLFVSLYYPALKDKFLHGIPGPLPALSSFAPRQLLMSACLGVWTVRLGSFLLPRALKSGGDSRFDRIRHNPKLFTYYWMAQATWVFAVGLPVWLVNTLPAHQHPALRPRDYVSLGIFASSLLFEVVADHQKSAWRKAKINKEHDEEFITKGLWSISRHPNYVGELGVWTGVWALSLISLQNPYLPRWTPVLAAASPLFTYLLVRRVSGVPPLEKIGDKKFGGNPKWEEYKRTVPVFLPWGPKN